MITNHFLWRVSNPLQEVVFDGIVVHMDRVNTMAVTLRHVCGYPLR